MKISFKVLPLTIIILFDAQLFSASKLWELPRVVPTFIRCFTTRAICPITIRRNVEAEFDKASIPLKLPAKVNTTLVTMRDGIQGQQKSVDLKNGDTLLTKRQVLYLSLPIVRR